MLKLTSLQVDIILCIGKMWSLYMPEVMKNLV